MSEPTNTVSTLPKDAQAAINDIKEHSSYMTKGGADKEFENALKNGDQSMAAYLLVNSAAVEGKTKQPDMERDLATLTHMKQEDVHALLEKIRHDDNNLKGESHKQGAAAFETLEAEVQKNLPNNKAAGSHQHTR